jgi:hypothetical protein
VTFIPFPFSEKKDLLNKIGILEEFLFQEEGKG